MLREPRKERDRAFTLEFPESWCLPRSRLPAYGGLLVGGRGTGDTSSCCTIELAAC